MSTTRATCKGIEYAGQHPKLIDASLFEEVRRIMDERCIAGEHRRDHHPYLKGSLFCSLCGSRMVFSRNRGHGGVYDYFSCMGRRNGCALPYLDMSKIESAVEDYYVRHVALGPTLALEFRRSATQQIREERWDIEVQVQRQEKQLAKLERSRARLVEAYMADAMELSQFKEEQEKLNKRIAASQRAVQIKDARWADIQTTFHQILYLAENCGEA